MNERSVYICCFFIYRILSVLCLTSSHIPTLLIPCYDGSFTMDNKPPLTIPILVELIRKIELYDETSINLRILTTSLLHQIIFDGVLKSDNNKLGERGALPFRARGHEFHKYKLINDYFVSGESTLFLNESLSQVEICYLHNMLSISTDTSYRGDEEVTCFYNKSRMPIPSSEFKSNNMLYSDCPLMKGNANTKWGTITPGHLIYGASAALQNTKTVFSKIVQAMNKTNTNAGPQKANSLWISTIAGDLAEVVLNQAHNNLKLGTSGFWNDSILFSSYYLSDNASEMTESKLLGGIDGLVIASNIEAWEKILMKTRLSQIIDMYYSNRGIAYSPWIRASNRTLMFKNIRQNTNLTAQVAGTANLLKDFGTYDVSLSEAAIEELAALAVTKFENLAGEVTKRYDLIDHVSERPPRSSLEIIVILEGGFDVYTSKQFIYSLAELSGVSIYNNKMGVINGETGEWLTNVTGNIFDLFRDLEMASSWPKGLTLHRPFEKIIAHYQNTAGNNCNKRPLGRVILLLSGNSRPKDPDTFKYKEAIYSVKNVFPETNVIFAISDEVKNNFWDISNTYENDSVISFSRDVLTLSSLVSNRLFDIPGQVVDIYCETSNKGMEDYLTPEIEKFYEVYRDYTRRYHFDIKFKGNGYGDIYICANYRSGRRNDTCQTITENEEVIFRSKDLCSDDTKCNLQFFVKANNSKIRCTENDCRYPDQVRLGITWTKSGSDIAVKSAYLIFVVLLTCFYSSI